MPNYFLLIRVLRKGAKKVITFNLASVTQTGVAAVKLTNRGLAHAYIH